MTTNEITIVVSKRDQSKIDEMPAKARKIGREVSDGIGGGVREADREVGKLGDRMDKLRHIGGVAAGVLGFGALAAGKELLGLGQKMDQLNAKAQVVFADQLPAVEAWAEANKAAFGVTQTEVVGMASALADLLKPMGFTTAQAADMSKQVLDLSGALARWSGGTRSVAEVSDILSAAFLGERDALQGLGISISQAEVDARVLANGQAELTGTALQQAEALATQQLIMEKSTDAQKAWAEGGREAAEQQNALSLSIAESGEKLAAILAPILETVVALAASIVDWVSKNETAALVIGTVTAAVWLLNAALNANPLVLIASLLIGVVGALTVLWTTSAGFRDFFINLWGAIRAAVASAVDNIKNITGGMWDGITAGLKAAVNGAIWLLNGLISGLNDIIYGMNLVNPFENIPYVPQVRYLAAGGPMSGRWNITDERGPELKKHPDGTWVVPAGLSRHMIDSGQLSGGAGSTNMRLHVAPGAGGAVAEMLGHLFRTEQITLEANGVPVRVVS